MNSVEFTKTPPFFGFPQETNGGGIDSDLNQSRQSVWLSEYRYEANPYKFDLKRDYSNVFLNVYNDTEINFSADQTFPMTIEIGLDPAIVAERKLTINHPKYNKIVTSNLDLMKGESIKRTRMTLMLVDDFVVYATPSEYAIPSKYSTMILSSQEDLSKIGYTPGSVPSSYPVLYSTSNNVVFLDVNGNYIYPELHSMPNVDPPYESGYYFEFDKSSLPLKILVSLDYFPQCYYLDLDYNLTSI